MLQEVLCSRLPPQGNATPEFSMILCLKPQAEAQRRTDGVKSRLGSSTQSWLVAPSSRVAFCLMPRVQIRAPMNTLPANHAQLRPSPSCRPMSFSDQNHASLYPGCIVSDTRWSTTEQSHSSVPRDNLHLARRSARVTQQHLDTSCEEAWKTLS